MVFFRLTLQDIEFCYRNLRDLPDDLDTKWLLGSIVFIEHSQFTTVPSVLMRLEPYYLFVTGNPINELPPEISEIPGIMYLIAGEMSALELPRTVTSLSPMLVSIYLTNTDVSFFWSWIDPLVSRIEEFGEPSLFMGGSAYCVELEKIVSGEAQAFSASPSSNYSNILMDPSDANRDVILGAFSYDNTVSATFYPIDMEDANSAII